MYIHLVWLCIIHLDWNNQCYFQEPCLFFLFVFCNTITAWFVGCPAAAVLSLVDRGGQIQGLSEWRAGESYSDTVTYRHTAQNKAWSKLDHGPLLAPQLGLLLTLHVKGNEWECRRGSIWARWHRAGTLPGYLTVWSLISSSLHPLHAGFFFFFFFFCSIVWALTVHMQPTVHKLMYAWLPPCCWNAINVALRGADPGSELQMWFILPIKNLFQAEFTCS